MIYAIDYGTSNSLLAAATKEQLFDPIPLDKSAEDPSILRSVLFFPSEKECFIGAEAIHEFVNQDMQGRLIRSIKKFLPMRSFLGTFVDNRALYIEDIIASFLGEMRRRANNHFQKDVNSVLLGRPARFADNDADDLFAQTRLETAARKAGFKNIEFCAEPLAASFEFKATLTETKIVLVADFGGGTSDFTVIKIGPEKFHSSDVLSIGGVTVAGDALDGTIMRKRISKYFGADVQYKAPFGSNILTMPIHLMEKICSTADISLLRERDTLEFFKNVKSWSLNPGEKAKMENLFSLIEDQIGFSVFEEIERTKRKLSSEAQANFSYKYSQIDIQETISRKEFDEYSKSVIDKILKSLDETVSAAGIKFSDIDLVCATGGTAKVASLREALALRFGPDKIQQHNHFHSIVYGLSRVAQELI